MGAKRSQLGNVWFYVTVPIRRGFCHRGKYEAVCLPLLLVCLTAPFLAIAILQLFLCDKILFGSGAWFMYSLFVDQPGPKISCSKNQTLPNLFAPPDFNQGFVARIEKAASSVIPAPLLPLLGSLSRLEEHPQVLDGLRPGVDDLHQLPNLHRGEFQLIQGDPSG